MDRTVLHCDCNSFFASVETVFNPSYANVPMAVCGSSEERHGIVLAKNELAKRFGVKTGEVIWQAKKKCPHLVIAQPHYREYEQFSRRIGEIFYKYTDLIEPFGIDESWLDVTASKNLFGDGKQIADALRERIYREVGITVSVGVSFNKVFAKLGSDYKKPDATTVISRENFKDIVYPLPVSALLFAGRSTTARLNRIGIKTVGDVALAGRKAMSDALGKNGATLFDYATGAECSPVTPVNTEREIKSVGNGMTFRRDLLGLDDIRAAVWALADTVSSRMRSYGVMCGTVAVAVRDTNLNTVSRRRKLRNPTCFCKDIASVSVDIIRELTDISKPIRSLTVTGMDICKADTVGVQQSFFSDESTRREKNEKLETAIDRIRARYGGDAVVRAGSINSGLGI